MVRHEHTYSSNSPNADSNSEKYNWILSSSFSSAVTAQSLWGTELTCFTSSRSRMCTHTGEYSDIKETHWWGFVGPLISRTARWWLFQIKWCRFCGTPATKHSCSFTAKTVFSLLLNSPRTSSQLLLFFRSILLCSFAVKLRDEGTNSAQSHGSAVTPMTTKQTGYFFWNVEKKTPNKFWNHLLWKARDPILIWCYLDPFLRWDLYCGKCINTNLESFPWLCI